MKLENEIAVSAPCRKYLEMLGSSRAIFVLLWFGEEGVIATLFQLHDYVDKRTSRAFVALAKSSIVFRQNPFVVLLL